MEFLSLQPFVPSGSNFEEAKQLFLEIGFSMTWEEGGYAGFAKDACKFILQKMDDPGFAENFMLSVNLTNVDEWWKTMVEKDVARKFGVRLGEPRDMPYGREVNLIDKAGVCWHFVQQ
jgi:hypothetical protein